MRILETIMYVRRQRRGKDKIQKEEMTSILEIVNYDDLKFPVRFLYSIPLKFTVVSRYMREIGFR